MGRVLSTVARFSALAATLAWGVGCGAGGVPSGADGGPDGADAAVDGGGNGVTVSFVTFGENGQPADGAPLDFEKFQVSQVTVQLHNLGLIGDTAPAGDLIVDSRALQYPEVPESQVAYPAAPPGLYSRYEFDVERTYAEENVPDGFEGQRLSVRVVGKAHLQGKDRDFIYADDQRVTIDLDFDEEVTPGIPGNVQVALDLQAWFDALNWQELSDEAGGGNAPILIGMGGSDDDATESLRYRMQDAFRIRQ